MLDFAFSVLYSSGPLQLAGAFLWGICSVILSPCGIAAVPLVIGYIENTDNPSRWTAFKISCAFCSGIIFNLLLVGFVTSSFALIFGRQEVWLTVFVGAVFIVMGAHMVGLIKLKWFSLQGSSAHKERRGLKGALVLGIVSGLALGPCSVAYVSPVLSLAMAKAQQNMLFAVSIVAAYALGYCLVLILAGTFAQLASGLLRDSPRGRMALKVLNILCGAVLIIVGIYLIHGVLYLYI